MSNFKNISINGREFQYERCYHESEYGESTWYNFYEGYTTTTYKKYLFFGETITIKNPKLVFTVYQNIESERLTKLEVRRILEKEIELLERKEEINRGELI